MAEEINIFERASREKIRFAYKGLSSVEDLWELPVQELDRIFKSANARLKVCKEESLLGSKSSENAELDLQVAIVRRIVEVKLAEAAEAKNRAERKAKKEKIMSILADKQDDSLRNMSTEELSKMLEGL